MTSGKSDHCSGRHYFRGSKKILPKQERKTSDRRQRFTLKGLITIKELLKNRSNIRSLAKDELGQLLCGAGVGITANMMERVDALVQVLHVDVTLWILHTTFQKYLRGSKKIKATYPGFRSSQERCYR